MTCVECRDAFSAYADDALSAKARGALETHLAGCADCRREWQRFFATVDLLHMVQPERAPAGFVDRVVAAARPLPWYRRLARGLLVPWPVKLPLQGAAIVMVAGLAVLVFQRSSELQIAAQAPEPARDRAREVLRQDALESRAPQTDRAAEQTPPAATAPEGKKRDAIAPTLADSRDAAAPAHKTEAGRLESAPPHIAQQQADEPIAARRQQAADPAEQNAVNARAARPAAAPAAPPASRSGAVAGTAPAESFGASRPKVQDRLAKEAERDSATQVQRLAVRVPPSVELSLTVGDRAAAEPAVASIVERLGGAMVPGAAPAAFEIMVPRDAYSTLTGDLARLGTLRVLRQPAELPDSVRIGLQLTP